MSGVGRPGKAADAPVDVASSTKSVVNLEPSEESMEEEAVNTGSDTVPTKPTTGKRNLKKDGMKVVSQKNSSLQSRKRRQNFSPAMATASKRPAKAAVKTDNEPASSTSLTANEASNSPSTVDQEPPEDSSEEESLEEEDSEVTINEDSGVVPTKPAAATRKDTKKDAVKSDAVKSDVVKKEANPPPSRKRKPSFSPARLTPSKRPARPATPPAGNASVPACKVSNSASTVAQEPSEESMDDEEYQETLSDESDVKPATAKKDAKKDAGKKDTVQNEDSQPQSRKRKQSFSPARAKSSSPVQCGFKSWTDNMKAHLSRFYGPPGLLESDDEYADAKVSPSSAPPLKRPKLKPSSSNLSEKELDRYMSKVWGDDSSDELSDTESDDGFVDEILELKHFYNRKLHELKTAYRRKMDGLADIAEVVPLCAQQKGLKEYISKGKAKIKSLDDLRLELKQQVADTLEELLSFRCGFRDNVYSKPRLPAKATRILSKWYSGHSKYPYPTHREKAELAERCKIKTAQVTQWFVNRRRSAKKTKGRAKRKARARSSSTKRTRAPSKAKAQSRKPKAKAQASSKKTAATNKKTPTSCRKEKSTPKLVKGSRRGPSKQPSKKAKK